MTTTSDQFLRADHVPGPPQGQWTYQDYAALPNDGNRYEILEGVLYMAPAPEIPHQIAVSRILTELMIHVEYKGLGRALAPPTDVELASDFVCEPDVVVVLKEHSERITSSRILGAPDLVVEVASPSTTQRDRTVKKRRYALAGIKEYWLVEPKQQTIEVLILENGEYYSLGVFKGKETLTSRIVLDFPRPVEHFFPLAYNSSATDNTNF